VARARSVLILGGGTVGVELAAEIAWRYGKGEKHVGIRHVCSLYMHVDVYVMALRRARPGGFVRSIPPP
jgi:hypothetical protein